ncbi:dipeptidase [Thermincola ferriacetica]
MMGATLEAKVRDFFMSGFIADAHCDTLLDLAQNKRRFMEKSSTGHLDFPRMEEGRVALQFFAAFIGSEYKPERALKRTLQLIDVFYKEVLANDKEIVLGTSYRQIKRAIQKKQQKVALLTIEGGEALAGDLHVLHVLYRLGVRGIGLTWNQRNDIADGVWESTSGGGLTNFGRRVVREMNKLGMIVDLAHIAEKGFWDTMQVSEKPVMVSHANCRKVHDHPRNLSDEQIKALADAGGVIGLTLAPDFIGKERDLDSFLAHVDHVAGLVGTKCIAIGSDYDGIEETPAGLEDVTKMPNLVIALFKRGYTLEEVKNIMGQNLLDYLAKIL